MTWKVGELGKTKLVTQSKESTYPDYDYGAPIAKIDQDKLKQSAEQLNSVFTTKIELNDKDLEWEIGNFLIFIIKNYTPLKIVDNHDELISLNEIDKIII